MMPASVAVAAATADATATAAAAVASAAATHHHRHHHYHIANASDLRTGSKAAPAASQAIVVVADVERRALRKELQKWNRAALMAVGE